MSRPTITFNNVRFVGFQEGVRIEVSGPNLPDVSMTEAEIVADKVVIYKEIVVEAKDPIEVPKDIFDQTINLAANECGEPEDRAKAAAEKSGLMRWLKSSRPADYAEAAGSVIAQVIKSLAGGG